MSADGDKVRYFFAIYRQYHPRATLLAFAKLQATKTLGTSLYGDPALYQRWLKKKGWA